MSGCWVRRATSPIFCWKEQIRCSVSYNRARGLPCFPRGCLLRGIPRMPLSWRENRLSELNGLRTADPARLILMYRDVAGLGVDNQLPRHASFMSMIDAIVDSEEQALQSVGVVAHPNLP